MEPLVERGNKPRILVVEPNSEFEKSANEGLLGNAVFVAPNLEVTLFAMRSVKYDFVMADAFFPTVEEEDPRDNLSSLFCLCLRHDLPICLVTSSDLESNSNGKSSVIIRALRPNKIQELKDNGCKTLSDLSERGDIPRCVIESDVKTTLIWKRAHDFMRISLLEKPVIRESGEKVKPLPPAKEAPQRKAMTSGR